MKKEIAKPITWPMPWDVGAPEPSIIANGYKLLLVYYARNATPEVSKSELKVIGDPKAGEFVALVEFLGWIDFRFGGPDEDGILSPHSIEGLRPYAAFEVANSRWLANLREIFSSVHENEIHDWEKYKHFVLGFHDQRFECITKSFFIEAYSTNIEEVYDIAYDRITGAEWWMKGSKSDFRCPNCKKYLSKHAYANYCMHCGAQLANE